MVVADQEGEYKEVAGMNAGVVGVEKSQQMMMNSKAMTGPRR